MDSLNFSDLEFNLYEILNLPQNCTNNDIRTTFKKLVKKFHPDKITELEEKIYYYITLANHILTDVNSRAAYDRWLLNFSNNVEIKQEDKEERENMDKYFPNNYFEATKNFNKEEYNFKKRHGLDDEDNRTFSELYDDKINKLNNLENIEKENFKNMKDFNNKFDNRMKPGGKYSNNVIIYDKNNQIVKHNIKNNQLKYSNLRDLNKMYCDDTVIGSYYTSIDIAYKLQPISNVKTNDSLDNAINDYNSQTNDLYKSHNNQFNNFNI
jgi:curved DNA-binding protein CbpA